MDAWDRLTFLNRVSARIGSRLEVDRTADELVRAVVPYFADLAVTQLLDTVMNEEPPALGPQAGHAGVRVVAVAQIGESGDADGRPPIGEVIHVFSRTPFLKALLNGETVRLPARDTDTAALVDERFAGAGRFAQGRSVLVVPLSARGTVLGNLVLMRGPGRPPFDDADVTTGEDLADRAALCLDNARLYRRESRVAQELQRGMLPRSPVAMAGIEVDFRYLPASRSAQVGGDWFDVLSLPGRRVALVIGDVMGHGLSAAVAMGQLRTITRTLAALDFAPHLVLRHLDEIARQLGGAYLATCVYAVYDPLTRRCRIAGAGHLPPVLVTPDGRSELLDLPTGAPIGVGGVGFSTVEREVPDGSVLVFYTDGLVEVRGQDIGRGLDDLRARLAGPQRSPNQICETLLRELHTDDRQDDVSLLVARLDGIPGENAVSWTLDSGAVAARQARALTRDQLHAWKLDQVTDTVELLVDELVANAVRHGDPPVTLRLIRGTTLLCEVTDGSSALPYLRDMDVTDEYGRGLHLVDRLAAGWGAGHTATGKVVWIEYLLPERADPAH